MCAEYIVTWVEYATSPRASITYWTTYTHKKFRAHHGWIILNAIVFTVYTVDSHLKKRASPTDRNRKKNTGQEGTFHRGSGYLNDL